MADNPKPKTPELRMILIGKTGTGKSATGNTILGKSVFKSESSCSSVTSACKLGRSERHGRRLLVVDTPGLFDTGLNNDSVTTELLKCVGLSAPGPHAIILTIPVGRFTAEEKEAVSLLQRIFGFDMTKFLIVVFTRKDELQRSKKSIHDLIVECPQSLQWVLQSCEYRCIAFDNFAENGERDKQVLDLLNIVDEVLEKNDGGFYRSPIFDESEAIIQEREKEIINEKEKIAYEELRNYSVQLSQECRCKLEQNMNLQVEYKNNLKSLRRRLDQMANTYVCHQRPFQSGYSDADETELRKTITDLERKLVELQTDRQSILTSMQGHRREREDQLHSELLGLSAREDVCRELEDGDAGVLRRLWFRITGAGHDMVDKFRYLFINLGKKKGSKMETYDIY